MLKFENERRAFRLRNFEFRASNSIRHSNFVIRH